MASGDSQCPQCGGVWDTYPDLIGKRAERFEDCAFRCHHCGIALSNSKDPARRIRITREPELNVPREVRGGLRQALADAATVGNRPAKQRKFCSARSEDAVTWTVVNGLLQIGRAGALIGDVGVGAPNATLLWGSPAAGTLAHDLAARLVAVSDQLGENADWRSEPDVMLLWPDLLVLIEAKYGSGNDSSANHPAYPKYLREQDLFTASTETVAAEGSYQLTRNWVIGNMLARQLGLPLRLINLGPKSVAKTANTFSGLLSQTAERSFQHRTWSATLQSAAPLPAWLDSYADLRRLHR